MARPRRSLHDVLRSVADELEREEETEALEDRLRRLEGDRAVTMEQVLAVVENASDDELEALRGTLLGEAAAREQRERESGAGGAGGEGGEGGGGTPPPPEPRRRPGRKKGAAYTWDVDDEGNVRQLDTAKVYQGADEPDEVELPAETPAAE